MERPEEAKQAENLEEEWNAMQMAREEDPCPSMGMGWEAEETPPGMESRQITQMKETTDPEVRNELHEDREGEADPWGGVGMDDAGAVLTEEPRQNSPLEGERPAK